MQPDEFRMQLHEVGFFLCLYFLRSSTGVYGNVLQASE